MVRVQLTDARPCYYVHGGLLLTAFLNKSEAWSNKLRVTIVESIGRWTDFMTINMQSAFEKEALLLLERFRRWLDSHDRVVLLGLLFAIPPLPPLPIVGLFLSLINYRLWKQHKLDTGEIGLIRLALIISTLSSAVAVGLMFLVVNFLNSSLSDGPEIISRFLDALRYFFQSTINHLPLHKSGVVNV